MSAFPFLFYYCNFFLCSFDWWCCCCWSCCISFANSFRTTPFIYHYCVEIYYLLFVCHSAHRAYKHSIPTSSKNPKFLPVLWLRLIYIYMKIFLLGLIHLYFGLVRAWLCVLARLVRANRNKWMYINVFLLLLLRRAATNDNQF